MVAESVSPAPTVATRPLPHSSSVYIKCPVLVYHETALHSSSQSEAGKTEIKCEARGMVPEGGGQVWMDDRQREADGGVGGAHYLPRSPAARCVWYLHERVCPGRTNWRTKLEPGTKR